MAEQAGHGANAVVPFIAEPARRIIERIASAVGGNRDGSAIEQQDALVREVAPLFASLGMTDEGHGLGFDEDQFETARRVREPDRWDCGNHHLHAQAALILIGANRIADRGAMEFLEGLLTEAGPSFCLALVDNDDQVPF